MKGRCGRTGQGRLWAAMWAAALVGIGFAPARGRAQAVDSAAADTMQVEVRTEAPRVYINCDACDMLYLRQQIRFINFVRDPEQAQVSIFVTTQRVGSGGIIHQIELTGQEDFTGVDNRLTYISEQTNTWEERRRGLLRVLQAGLVPYVARTPLAQRLTVRYDEPANEAPLTVEDPWHSWVFDIDGGGSFSLEESQQFYSVNGSLSADRVTEAFKVRNRLYGDYNQRRFERDSGPIVSRSHEAGYNTTLVQSIGGHWAAGASAGANTNTYRNTDFSASIGPAAEYNIYPYAESARRELSIAYRLNAIYRDYTRTTVYLKDEEFLVSESLSASARVQQPWGFIYAGISGAHYFHDFSKRRLETYSNVSFRLAKGLSVRFSGSFEVIRDQLYLAAGEASLEEVLLQQRQLATAYELRGSVGLAYTFGSMYNNVVNTRL